MAINLLLVIVYTIVLACILLFSVHMGHSIAKGEKIMPKIRKNKAIVRTPLERAEHEAEKQKGYG